MFIVKAVLIMTLTKSAGHSIEYLQVPNLDDCQTSRSELVKFGPPDGVIKMHLTCAPLKVYADGTE